MASPHDRIRDRAYEIWDREGRPADRSVENWLQAEGELGSDPVDGPVAPREAGPGPDETVETISDRPNSSIETLTRPAPDSVERDA